AIDQLRKTQEILRHFPVAAIEYWVHRELSWNYRALAQFDSAWAEYDRATELRELEFPHEKALILASEGRRAEARQELMKIQSNINRAKVLVSLGDFESAFDLLDQAVAQKSRECIHLRISPFWDPIRSDPKFQVYLDTLGFLF
ncbi:hypothetical protein ACFL39_02120, partial [Gemmatimonadota bacterium]